MSSTNGHSLQPDDAGANPGPTGRTLIITGASRGIGAATARAAAREGWRVVGTYLGRREAAEAVAGEIADAGGEAVAVQADTSVEADVLRLFDSAEDRFGRVAGLVNNAGINGPLTTVANLATENLRRLIDINVVGYFLCAREAVRRMARERGGEGGAIVNVASVAALRGNPNERVHYAASKGAVVTMSTGLAQEVARSGIRVNAVSPGIVDTEMNPAERLERVGPSVPLGRAANPEEIARVILFLLSPASSYMVGANVTVSGGR